jgi:hypothetical protein
MFLLPLACVCAGFTVIGAWDAVGALPLGTSYLSAILKGLVRVALVGATTVVMGTSVFAIVRVERHFVQQGLTNEVFLQLRNTLTATGTCPDPVFIEDTDVLVIPNPPDRYWTGFNYQSTRQVVALSGCVHTVAPSPRLVELLAARPSPAWLIASARSVPGLSGRLNLVPVMPIAPEPTVPEDLRLTLYRVQPRP